MAPVDDIRAQLEGNTESVDQILSSGPIQYAFEERSRIAKTFFDPPSTIGVDGNIDWRVSVVDDLVSLCTLQEGRFRKPRLKQRTQAVQDHPDNLGSDCVPNPVKSEPSELEFQVPHSSLLICKPFQCLVCLGDCTLPLSERQHNLGSKFSLQRHFDRCHTFRPGESCPFPHPECAAVTLNSLMHFKNHAAMIHGIHMSKKT